MNRENCSTRKLNVLNIILSNLFILIFLNSLNTINVGLSRSLINTLFNIILLSQFGAGSKNKNRCKLELSIKVPPSQVTLKTKSIKQIQVVSTSEFSCS